MLKRKLTFAKKPNAREVKVSIIFSKKNFQHFFFVYLEIIFSFLFLFKARLGEIDTINEKFSCEATLFITWIENKQLFEKSYENENGVISYDWDTSKLWDPQLYIDSRNILFK